MWTVALKHLQWQNGSSSSHITPICSLNVSSACLLPQVLSYILFFTHALWHVHHSWFEGGTKPPFPWVSPQESSSDRVQTEIEASGEKGSDKSGKEKLWGILGSGGLDERLEGKVWQQRLSMSLKRKKKKNIYPRCFLFSTPSCRVALHSSLCRICPRKGKLLPRWRRRR